MPLCFFRRMHRRAAAVLLSLVLWSVPAAGDMREVRDEALFRIVATNAQGDVRYGTGFLHSNTGWLWTAYHVVAGAKTITLTRFEGTRLNDVTIGYIAPQWDLALIHAHGIERTLGYPTAGSSKAGKAGDAVALHGYPLGFPRQVILGNLTQDGLMRGSVWTGTSRTGRPTSIFSDTSIRILPLDVTGPKGLSGAPVLDATGSVIGVFSGSIDIGRGYAWAIPTDVTRDTWTEIRKPVAEVAWPAGSVLRAGFDMTRSLAVLAPTSRSEECRAQLDAYSDARVAQAATLLEARSRLSLADDLVERAAPDTRRDRFRVVAQSTGLVETLSRATEAWNAAETSHRNFLTYCLYGALGDLIGGLAPTRENFLLHGRLATLMNEEGREWVDSMMTSDEVTTELAPLLDDLARLKDAGGDELVEVLGRMNRRLGEFADREAADREAAPLRNFSLKWLDALAAVESDAGGAQPIEIEAHGFSVKSAQNWIPFDDEVARAWSEIGGPATLGNPAESLVAFGTNALPPERLASLLGNADALQGQPYTVTGVFPALPVEMRVERVARIVLGVRDQTFEVFPAIHDSEIMVAHATIEFPAGPVDVSIFVEGLATYAPAYGRPVPVLTCITPPGANLCDALEIRRGRL